MLKVLHINVLRDSSNISRFCKENNPLIIIIKNEYGDMIMMSVKVYEELLIKLEVASKINESLKDKPTMKSELFFSEMKKKYGE